MEDNDEGEIEIQAKFKKCELYELLDYTSLLLPKEFSFVYRPNDDTFLLMDALKLESEGIPSNSRICEVCCGSGVVISHLASWLKSKNCEIFALDVNYDACVLTKRISEKFQLGIEVMRIDGLSQNFRNSSFDLIICNPVLIFSY